MLLFNDVRYVLLSFHRLRENHHRKILMNDYRNEMGYMNFYFYRENYYNCDLNHNHFACLRPVGVQLPMIYLFYLMNDNHYIDSHYGVHFYNRYIRDVQDDMLRAMPDDDLLQDYDHNEVDDEDDMADNNLDRDTMKAPTNHTNSNMGYSSKTKKVHTNNPNKKMMTNKDNHTNYIYIHKESNRANLLNIYLHRHHHRPNYYYNMQ